MIAFARARPLLALLGAFAAGVAVVLAVWGLAAALGAPDDDSAQRPPGPSVLPGATQRPTPTPTPSPSASATPSPEGEACGAPTVTVADAEELVDALAAAAPGDVIELAPGRYEGSFVASVSGTPDAPITLCGSEAAILDGGGTDEGYVFHLDRASHWRLLGFTVTNGQKGVMADTTVGSVIGNLTVHKTGDEAIHLRNFSTDNLVVGNRISDTGHRKPKFGEGVYIGTAESNWCTITECQPDASDRNIIEGNVISGTTSEAIDIKEGSTGGVVRGNSFDGSSITGADSWVDVKGNGYLIEANTGVNSPLDGFQTHEILDGWGTDNVFRNNTATVNGPGFGFSLTPERDNVVECGNTATAAGEGESNVECTSS